MRGFLLGKGKDYETVKLAAKLVVKLVCVVGDKSVAQFDMTSPLDQNVRLLGVTYREAFCHLRAALEHLLISF